MAATLRVLHVAGEAVPFCKTGGLADVVGALPAALKRSDCDARVVIPGYRQALRVAEEHGLEWLDGVLVIEAGGIDHRVGIGRVTVGHVTCYLLACNELYDREGLYGPTPGSAFEDNARRFAVLCKAALALPRFLEWIPHIVHAHDWQAGFVPALLQRGFARVLPATRCVFTIHNVAYQGIFPSDTMRLFGLDPWLYNPAQVEHHGSISALKAGIVFADRVTTVSRRYAEEIQTAEYGHGMEAVLRHHAYKLSGIANGIDASVWNPSSDPHLPAHYSRGRMKGKAACRQALVAELGLDPIADDVCLVGTVSRLVQQKGIELIIEGVGPYILDGRMALVVLGAGEPVYEQALRMLQGRHPGQVCFWHGYNEGLAHRIEAGCDLFLMPSLFEPCGLNQMYSLRYGTLPLVRHTGGLADTVADVCDPERGNGFTFGPTDLGHFSSVLDRALGLYRYYPRQWKAAVKRAMAADHSWTHVGEEYGALYRSLVIA
ncbi:MAG: glycogen synthase GlgA [Planctomycetota bacterium]